MVDYVTTLPNQDVFGTVWQNYRMLNMHVMNLIN